MTTCHLIGASPRVDCPPCAGRVVELGVAESNAAYFDSVLTVRSNLALIERVLTELA